MFPHSENILTHLPIVPHICVSELGQHWFRWWLVAWSAPSHYLNQCWNIVNGTLGNKLQWKLDRNKNAIEKVVCEMSAILSPPQCVEGNTSLTHNNQLNGETPCFLAKTFGHMINLNPMQKWKYRPPAPVYRNLAQTTKIGKPRTSLQQPLQ